MGICEGRTVIITGAGGGLGRAYALAFAAEGASVVVNDIRQAAAEAVVAEIAAAGGQAIANSEPPAEPEDLFQRCIALSGCVAEIWLAADADAARSHALQRAYRELGMDSQGFELVLQRVSQMLPELRSVRPARQLSAVDLPQPEGPSRATNSPRWMLRCRSASAATVAPDAVG